MTGWSAGTALRRLRSPDGLADPYRIYREIRRATGSGRPIPRVLHRHRDVRLALEDRTLRSDRVSAILRPLANPDREAAATLEDTLRRIVVFTDPPDHRRLRRLLTHAFTPRTVERARPAITATVDTLLDRLEAGTGAVDLHGELAYPLPAMVLSDLLGIPPDMRDAFRSWAHDLVTVVGSGQLTAALAARADRNAVAMRALVSRLMAGDRTEGLFDAMLSAALDEGRLSLARAYNGSPYLRAHLTAAGITPAMVRAGVDLAGLPFTTKADLRDTSVSGYAAVPSSAICPGARVVRHDGPAHVVAYTRRDIDDWMEMLVRCYRYAGLGPTTGSSRRRDTACGRPASASRRRRNASAPR